MTQTGFYPALGTPLDENGGVIVSSLQRHVEEQVQAGAAGMLVMGTMGQQAYVKGSEYAKVARAAVEAAKGACPVYVGVMDNAVARVRDRIDALQGLAIDGVVATTPYYHTLTQTEIVSFFTAVAQSAPAPLYLYDLPGVTQSKISVAAASQLMTVPNIAGIKTGDLTTARVLARKAAATGSSFRVLFSGLDQFDIAYGYGLDQQLDGMFSCTAPLTAKMYTALAAGDMATAADCLDGILQLRDVFVEVGVFQGFTCAMNAQGFKGNFHPDYMQALPPQQQEKVVSCLKQLGLV